ncbi:MAG TPA: glycosyltransferase family 2 protein [Dehalococcoidales bacterium]|nr:glycosyltransferase family 2 protein [Dehalococcoidales bacterium]
MEENFISIVIPTYNEKDNIVPLVERLSQTLKGRKFEILLVDDNSKDGTVNIAAKMAETYPVKVMVRTKERGLATAVLHGFKYARGNIIGVMDADLQHPPEKVADLLKALDNGADMAIGSRYVPGGGVPNWGLLRRIISKGASSIAHLFLPTIRRIKDPMSGFYMFKREALGNTEFNPIGYKILLEMLVMGNFKNVVEVPFIFEDRSSGRSKMKARQQIEYLRHILSLMRRKGELTRIGKFLIVGLSGVVVNQGLLWLLTHFGGLKYYFSALIAIEASIISNFIFNNYFTFADRSKGGKASFITRLLKFNLTCAAGAVIQYGILLLLTEVAGINYLISNLIGILVAFVWNYLLSTLWTWK